MANRRRLAIINFLMKSKEASVAEIAEQIKLSFRSTSKHLNTLRLAGFIDREQRKLQVFYCIDKTAPATIKNLIKIL